MMLLGPVHTTETGELFGAENPPDFVSYSGLENTVKKWGVLGRRITGLEWTEEPGRAGYLLTWARFGGTWPALRTGNPLLKVKARSDSPPDDPY
jgi:hypothetical protein